MHENSGYIPHPMRENQMNYHFQLPQLESMDNSITAGTADINIQNGRLYRNHNARRSANASGKVGYNRYSAQRRSYHGQPGSKEFTLPGQPNGFLSNSNNNNVFHLSQNGDLKKNGLSVGKLNISNATMERGMANGSTKGSGGHLSNYSNGDVKSNGGGDHSDHDDSFHDGHIQEEATSLLNRHINKDNLEAWWTIGEFLEGRQVTHQSAKFTLTGNRVFGNYDNNEDVWDLSDSLAELYETSLQQSGGDTLPQPSKRHKGIDNNVDIRDWLSKDTSNGFIRVYPPDMNAFTNSQLVPLTLSTTAHKICLLLGLAVNALHIQLNGDKVRRLDPYEHPLVLQNQYLAGLGYSDVSRIQQEGAKTELAYLVKFYSGKPMVDSTFSRNQLQAWIDIKKGKVMANWVKRLCVVSGTRLLMYKDKHKKNKASVIQLACGSVEEVQGVKGYEMVLKLTSTLEGEKIIFLSFAEQKEYDKWYRKCKKATDKLPTSADLSNCHLEFLPETIFINDQLAMLNLRHNVLKERPIEEDIYTIGWLDDLPKFQRLRSLNLADNNLVTFPLSLCAISTLVELNIASNQLEEIPSEIQNLVNLQALHIHNNHLSGLPMELTNLSRLFILVLAFNHFTTVPPVVAHMTDVRISEVENIIMAGNAITHIPPETLSRMKYVKKADFRMNQLILTPSETVKFSILEHMTHLDIRDNIVKELDIRSLKSLEYLNVERNEMTILQVNGMALKNLFAAHNVLERLLVTPKPEWLLQMDVNNNRLRRLPEWLSDCFFLQKLNASHNLISDLPPRLLVDAKRLKSLRVNHNRLTSLPCEVDTLSLEELHVQHNSIARLPNEIFRKANKLRVFNGTKNRLMMLPELNSNTDLNKVQEMYLTSNMLGDSAMETIAGYQRMKVLHIAHNEIHNLHDRDFEKLEMLQEFNVSGNQLRSLPLVLGRISKLVILRAHSNILQSLPDFKGASALRILDVGHNQLLNVSMTSLMASQLNLLDMSLNAQLRVDPREFKTVKHRKSVCLVDSSGQNRVLPGLHRKQNRPTTLDEYETDPSLAWKVGFSETSGIRNKLCIATLKILKFESENASLFGMFDGGHNNEVPKVLLDKVPSIMRDQRKQDPEGDKYMKYTMLNAHRILKEAGQRVGASAALCHIEREKTSSANHNASQEDNNLNQYVLKLANVGDVEVVMCRRGEALCLSRKFTTLDDYDECHRVYSTDGIITEDNKVNGSTKCTRQLGNSYLYPHVIPDPHTCTVTLRHDDEFLIIANKGLWKYVSYDDAVEEIYDIGNPVVAAKKLQDLVQGYGSKENIGICVIRLNTDRGPSLARLRQHKSMSIDDVEAAAAHDAKLLQLQRQRSRDLSPPQTPRLQQAEVNGHHTRDGRPPPLKPERKRRSVSVPPQSAVPREGHSLSTITDSTGFHQSSIVGSSSRNQSNTSIKHESRNQSNTSLKHESRNQSNSSLKRESRNQSNSSLKHESRNQSNSTLKHESRNQSNSTLKHESSSTLKAASHRSSRHDNNSPPPVFNASHSSQIGSSPPSAFRVDHIDGSSTPTAVSPQPSLPDLKPLPNQRYRKKNAACEWEELLQKRLTDDVKDKEMKQASRSVSEESVVTAESRALKSVAIDIGPSNSGSSKHGSKAEVRESHPAKPKEGLATWRDRQITQPPSFTELEGKLNTVYLAQTMQDETELKADLEKHENMSSHKALAKKNPKMVRNKIAMFENLNTSPTPDTKNSHNSPPAKSPEIVRRVGDNKRSNKPVHPVVPGDFVHKKTTVVVIERDERGKQHSPRQHSHEAKATNQNTDHSQVKVDIQTVPGNQLSAESLAKSGSGSAGALSSGAASPTTVAKQRTLNNNNTITMKNPQLTAVQANPTQAGSLEADLYNSVKKVVPASSNSRTQQSKVVPASGSSYSRTQQSKVTSEDTDDNGTITQVTTEENGEVRIVEIARL